MKKLILTSLCVLMGMSIRMVVVLFISLYTTRAVLKVLGIEDYGIYNVVCGFVSMFSFLNNSMASATQRYYNYELGKNGEIGVQKIHFYYREVSERL